MILTANISSIALLIICHLADGVHYGLSLIGRWSPVLVFISFVDPYLSKCLQIDSYFILSF